MLFIQQHFHVRLKIHFDLRTIKLKKLFKKSILRGKNVSSIRFGTQIIYFRRFQVSNGAKPKPKLK